MGMETMLFNSFNPAESFELIVNTPFTEGPMWNLVKISRAVSEKTFKDYMILYMSIVQGQEQITQGIERGGVGDGRFWYI